MPKNNLFRPKLTLITNLSFMQSHGSDARLHVYALLVEQGRLGLGDRTNAVRGFLTDGSLEVFDLFVEKLPMPLAFTDAKGRDIFIGCDGQARPLFSGAFLQLAGGESFYLNVNDSSQPLDIAEFTTYDALWDALPRKVARYWTAPYMPLPKFTSAEQVRLLIPDRRKK